MNKGTKPRLSLGVLIGLLLLLCPMATMAQTVKGIVKDSKGEALVGVTVRNLNLQNVGTITNMDGKFEVKAETHHKLQFSYIGFKTEVLEVTSTSRSMEVTLHEDLEQLEEVVVVGYARGSKGTISGAVAKVSAEDMNKGVVTNPLQALQGKVPGVNIRKVGGDPTAGASVRIRGTTSLSGGNEPLVVIDGVFGNLSQLNAIAPTDIASFSILKDASETAQYGSRGAAGVIVVTTKKGKSGKGVLTYDGTYGVETPYKRIEMLDAEQYRSVVAQNGLINAVDGGAATDFMKEMMQTGYTQDHRLSFSGGNEEGTYRASLGIVDQKGILLTNSMRNYTLKLDGSQYFFDHKLKLEAGAFGSSQDNRYINDYQKTFYSAASSNPTLPVAQNADGTWPEDPNANEIDNPLGRLTINDRNNNTLLTATGRLTWTITPDLSLSAFGSYTYSNQEMMQYVPNNIKQGIRAGRGEAFRGYNRQDNMLTNLTLSYLKNVDLHRIDALAVAEYQQYDSRGSSVRVNGFDTNFFGYNNLAAGAIVKWGGPGSYANNYRLNSYLMRLNYIYNDRYIATVNMRADGSSKLGSNNKWGFFPSGSLAWVISREDFMQGIDKLDQLKLRAGYGVTGNQDAISPYNSLKLMSPNGLTEVDGVPTVTFGYTRNANPDLRWETKKMFDTGLELSVDQGRLTGVLDYYYSKTTNLLYNYQVPVPPFVHPSLLANLGEMENSGVELSLSYAPIRTTDTELRLSANGAYQHNKLLSLSGTYMEQELSASSYMRLGGINGAGFIGGNTGVVYQLVGQPLGVFYLPKSNGLINDGFGNYTYNVLDLDGDGAKDISDGKDRYIAGQAMPKVIMGANIAFRYKAFDAQLQMNGAFGQKIYNGTSLTYMNMNTFPTYNVLPEAPEKNIRDNTVTDYWLERGDYWHIDYLTLGYTLDSKVLGDVVKSMRITASVNNLFTITPYSGLSPMINNSTVGGDLGVDDKRFYPLTRTYSVGLNITF